MDYNDAVEYFATARYPERGKPLCNNTRLFKRGDMADGSDYYAIRLHNTDVIEFHWDGRVVLNSGGWKTVTTKDRMQSYSGLSIRSKNGVWYVEPGYDHPSRPQAPDWDPEGDVDTYEGNWERFRVALRAWENEHSQLFFDGITFRDGECLNGVTPEARAAYEKSVATRKKEISRYVTNFLAALRKGMDMPSGGDCWYCSMTTDDLQTLGDATYSDHLLSHIEEGYYVPWLIVNALRESGYSDVGISVHLRMDHDARTMGGPKFSGMGRIIGGALRKYLWKRLQPAEPARQGETATA